MNKIKFLLVLVALSVSVLASAAPRSNIRRHLDRLELGVFGGVGFFAGQTDPDGTGNFTRVQMFDALGYGYNDTFGWPGIETFGFSVGYRLDTHWNVVAKATRQRFGFAEWGTEDFNQAMLNGQYKSQTRSLYYNAAWHVDLMAEYNILSFGNVMMARQNVYNVVPYVGLGIGLSVFNQDATLRNAAVTTQGDINTMYPRVGFAKVGDKWGPTEKALGLYLPVALGVKWRINDYVQLKGAVQYQMHFSSANGALSNNLDGASYVAAYQNTKDRPTFEQLTQQPLRHNTMFSLSAIFNIGKWYETRLVTY